MSIGSTIKKLRRQYNMTQEQLAEYLGITANSVSQWECDRTAPDISQLPVLANIFNVTTDHILEVDTSKKNETIESIRQNAWELCNSGDKTGAINLIRQGLTKFPNNYKMMSDLTVFIYQQAFHQERTTQERYDLCNDAAVYIDKILTGCSDINTKFEAVQLACCIFPYIGRYDDALKLTDLIPDISKDDLLSALYNGDKLTEHIRSRICKSLTFAADQIIWLASVKKTDGTPLYNDDDKLLLYEKTVSIYNTLYENGDHYFDAEALSQAEIHIVDIWIKKQNIEKALYYLEKCIDHIIMFDTYDDNKDCHTSLLLLGEVPVGINRNTTANSSHNMLNKLKNNKNYELITTHPRYDDLIKRLEQTDNMK